MDRKVIKIPSEFLDDDKYVFPQVKLFFIYPNEKKIYTLAGFSKFDTVPVSKLE